MHIPEIKQNLNPRLIGDVLFRKDKRLKIFLDLSKSERIELIHKVTLNVRRDLVTRMPHEDLVKLLESLDPDDATDILQLLSKVRRKKTLLLLNDDVKKYLSTLLEFDSNTAAGLMTLDFIKVDIADTFEKVAQSFRQYEKKTSRLPTILVMSDGLLIGFLPVHEIGFAKNSESISQYVKNIPSISYAASHDKVIDKFRSHPHKKIVVLNDNDDVIGIIYSDDVLNLIGDRTASSLYDFAGVSSEESVTDSTRRKVSFRYKWLIINLATAFLAAYTVGLFEETISKYVLLAVYMPIVAGMGGNAATQTLAVLVRGIALKQISLKTAFGTLKNEVGAGLVNGLINGFLVAFVVIVKDNDWQIALVLAMAMVVNLVIAAIFGTLVPLVMNRLRKDPASSATIFITTATDVLGFLTFLGLATIILPK